MSRQVHGCSVLVGTCGRGVALPRARIVVVPHEAFALFAHAVVLSMCKQCDICVVHISTNKHACDLVLELLQEVAREIKESLCSVSPVPLRYVSPSVVGQSSAASSLVVDGMYELPDGQKFSAGDIEVRACLCRLCGQILFASCI